jgi:hypothetical protein
MISEPQPLAGQAENKNPLKCLTARLTKTLNMLKTNKYF